MSNTSASFPTVIYVCPYCEHKYKLGFDGTVDGCDECLGIVRNALDHSIITSPVPASPCACFEFIGDNPNCPEHGKQ